MAELSFADTIAIEDLGANRFRSADERPIEFFLGGKEIAAAVRAAATTLESELRLFSVGTYFVGRRDPAVPLYFSVRELRDGRSFATREIEATTDSGGLWFKSIATFHALEEGVHQQIPMPPAPRPDELLSAEQEAHLGADRPRNAVAFPWDADFELRFEHIDDTQYRFWARTRLPVGGDPVLQDCAVVYATDVRGGSPGMLVTGWPNVRINGATLDHTVWLHRPSQPDAWFLVDVRPEATMGCRALSTATIHSGDGVRVASYAQSTLVRPISSD